MPKRREVMMSRASHADIGATKKPNMYHMVPAAQLSSRNTVERTRATKCEMTYGSEINQCGQL